MKAGTGGGSFDAVDRRGLALALARGLALECPRCAAPMIRQEVRPGQGVPYVRRRVWVLCPVCRRSAALDLDRPSDG
ncbi:MAG: hypothetical protein FIB01_03735 [Gemmatimonadetes bacterium]|nr:hypothetical protein [Gemmatimonadota bacterium]